MSTSFLPDQVQQQVERALEDLELDRVSGSRGIQRRRHIFLDDADFFRLARRQILAAAVLV